jgi:hypothetical protein
MQVRRRIVVLVTIASLALLWALVTSDDELSDEDQVRAIIKSVAAGAEAGDIEQVMAPIAQRYADPEGLDRRGIYGIFWSQFRKRGPITVWLSGIDVHVETDQARASFDAGLAEGQPGQRIGIPVNLDALTFEVDLSRSSDGWEIVSHTRWPALDIERTAGP